MSGRQATVIVADDFRVSLNGKFDISGIYSGDISIPTDPTIINQLVFIVTIETDITDPFQSITLEILIPGNALMRVPLPVPAMQTPIPDGRTRFYFRHPQLAQVVVLKPGKIQVKVIHESGEIDAWAPWIVLIPSQSVSQSVQKIGD